MFIKYTKDAQTDLSEIHDYIAKDSLFEADNFIENLLGFIDSLTTFPNSCPIYKTKRGQKIRRMVFKKYLVFYIAHDEHIEILRITQGARNILKLKV